MDLNTLRICNNRLWNDGTGGPIVYSGAKFYIRFEWFSIFGRAECRVIRVTPVDLEFPNVKLTSIDGSKIIRDSCGWCAPKQITWYQVLVSFPFG